MFHLLVVVNDPLTNDSRELKRQFDPTTAPATLQAKWNALGPTVLGMITDVSAEAAVDPRAPVQL